MNKKDKINKKTNEKTIPLASSEKFLKKSGAKRISEEAKLELKKSLEIIAEEITKMAFEFAKHARRKTIKEEDIKLAIQNYNKQKQL
ncbi:MAG: NFYB/HAP3 family transcription factor subunit [Candidatus Woesearchaeota archaeon]